MDKRGQFFLIAAIIIIGVLFSLTTALNVARGGASGEQFYDLSREVDFETKRVMDYGVFNERDTNVLVAGFLEEYADYIAQERVLFLFGDAEDLKALYFSSRTIGSVGINTGTEGDSQTIPISDYSGSEALVSHTNGVITVVIDNVPYEFRLREGENFFFILIKEEQGESFVAAR